MKIHFITFGSKYPIDYSYALRRIKNEANKSNFFDKINVYQDEDLDHEFVKKYQDILCLTRGAGYWLWKIQIIKQKLQEIEENDIIVYLDAGSSINKNGKTRFDDYIESLNKSKYGFFCFTCESGRGYMIQELIDYFNRDKLILTDKLIESKNYLAGHLIIKKNNHSRLIIEEFFKLIDYNPYLITDKYNEANKKYATFKGDSRHDQSILTLLFKIYGCQESSDPHYFKEKNHDYPFSATRQRGPTKIQKVKHNQMLLLSKIKR